MAVEGETVQQDSADEAVQQETALDQDKRVHFDGKESPIIDRCKTIKRTRSEPTLITDNHQPHENDHSHHHNSRRSVAGALQIASYGALACGKMMIKGVLKTGDWCRNIQRFGHRRNYHRNGNGGENGETNLGPKRRPRASSAASKYVSSDTRRRQGRRNSVIPANDDENENAAIKDNEKEER